jgi:hypothetical protein
MPISLRAEGDEMGGNRITLMRFSAIHEQTGKVRRERSLPYTQWIAGALNLMPRWYIGSILRHVDFLASDVPGIPVPVFLGGARVRMQYAFGPTIGSAVNVTLLTYVDTCAPGHRRRHRCDSRLRRFLRVPRRRLRRSARHRRLTRHHGPKSALLARRSALT